MAEKAKDPNAKPKVKKEKYTVTLVDGTNAQLRFVAEVRNGKATSYVFHRLRNEKGKTIPGGQGRGATQAHASFEESRKAVDTASASAAKAGWVKRAMKGGGVRADAFDLKSLPAPKTK